MPPGASGPLGAGRQINRAGREVDREREDAGDQKEQKADGVQDHNATSKRPAFWPRRSDRKRRTTGTSQPPKQHITYGHDKSYSLSFLNTGNALIRTAVGRIRQHPCLRRRPMGAAFLAYVIERVPFFSVAIGCRRFYRAQVVQYGTNFCAVIFIFSR